MIKQTNYGRLDYTALEVGDKVAYLPGWGGSEPQHAKSAVVKKVTAKQVTVAWSETEVCIFMRESGNVVGASSSWRRATLISIERRDDAKKRVADKATFQSTLSSIEKIVAGYSKYNCDSILVADRNQLETLIASLATRNEVEED